MIPQYSHKKSDGQIRSEIEKGRATRKGMDGGKGGQTHSLQEREEESANLGDISEREEKTGSGDSRPSKVGHAGEGSLSGGRGGDGEARLGRRMTVALAMAWPRRAELWRKQCWRY